MVKREGDHLIIGKGSLYSLSSFTSPLVSKVVSSHLMGSGDDSDVNRIKLDLAKVHDKFKDLRRTTGNTTAGNLMTESLGLKNVQVLISK